MVCKLEQYQIEWSDILFLGCPDEFAVIQKLGSQTKCISLSQAIREKKHRMEIKKLLGTRHICKTVQDLSFLFVFMMKNIECTE